MVGIQCIILITIHSYWALQKNALLFHELMYWNQNTSTCLRVTYGMWQEVKFQFPPLGNLLEKWLGVILVHIWILTKEKGVRISNFQIWATFRPKTALWCHKLWRHNSLISPLLWMILKWNFAKRLLVLLLIKMHSFFILVLSLLGKLNNVFWKENRS